MMRLSLFSNSRVEQGLLSDQEVWQGESPTSYSSLRSTKDLTESASRTGNIFWNVCSFILITELCERLAYYGLTGSLVIFFTDQLRISSNLSSQLLSLFASITYAAPLLGAYVADQKLGRYKTILLFSVIYVIGMFLCTYASDPFIIGDNPDSASTKSVVIFFVALFGGVALGSGGIKPNVVVLGAEQFDTSKPLEAAQQQSYFNYFYWSINIGASFSFGYLAWIATHGAPPLISEDYGFFASFFIPSCFMTIAVLIFFLGRKRYKKYEPTGSALKDFFGVLTEAARRTLDGRIILLALHILVVAFFMTIISYFICMNCEGADIHNSSFLLAIFSALSVMIGTGLLIRYGQRSSYLQNLKQSDGGPFDAKRCDDNEDVIRQLPLMGFLIIFWCVYQQMTGNFVLQGCQMDLRLNLQSSTGVQVTPTQLNLLDCSIILTFIPIFDKYLYPAVGKCLGYSPRPLQKIGTGFVFAALAMLAAGWVEVQRKDAELLCTVNELVTVSNGTLVCPTGNNGRPSLPFSPGNGKCKSCDYEASTCGEDKLMSNLSVFYQVPQYLLVGVAEILISVPSYEMFYSEVPEKLKSTCQSLNLLTTTFGGILAGTINSLFGFWLPDNLNNGRMENMYFFIAVLCSLNLCAFVWTMSRGFEDGNGYCYKKNRKIQVFDDRDACSDHVDNKTEEEMGDV